MCQYSNVAITDGSCLGLPHPARNWISTVGLEGEVGKDERSQTLNLTFRYVTVSTLNPTVGMVVTLWLSLSLYKMANGDIIHMFSFQ